MKQKVDDIEGSVEELKGCRVQNIGLHGFAECLDLGPKACPYAVPFGYAFLCQHPRLELLIERTEQERARRAGAN